VCVLCAVCVCVCVFCVLCVCVCVLVNAIRCNNHPLIPTMSR